VTQPVRAFFNEDTGERFYTSVDPLAHEPSVSVTSVLSTAMPRQVYLMPWVAKVVAETAAELLMWNAEGKSEDWSWAYMDEKSGEIDYETLAKDLAQSWKWERDQAGELGDEAHVACEEVMRASKGDPEIAQAVIEGVTYSPGVKARLEHLLVWLQEHRVQVVATEFTIYNESYGYAGSCDLAAYVDGVPHVLDFKTGRVNPDAALQLVAYKYGEFTVDNAGNVHGMPFSTMVNVECAVIDLKPTFCRVVQTDSSDAMFCVFRDLMRLRSEWFGREQKNALGAVTFDSRKVGSDD
jgi:hypothetical protein